MENFLSEQLKRNIANHIAIEKAMGRDVTDEDCLDILEKGGKSAQLGEVRTWNGKEYIKTPKGWRPKPKGYREGNVQKETQKQHEKTNEQVNGFTVAGQGTFRENRDGSWSFKDRHLKSFRKIDAEGGPFYGVLNSATSNIDATYRWWKSDPKTVSKKDIFETKDTLDMFKRTLSIAEKISPKFKIAEYKDKLPRLEKLVGELTSNMKKAPQKVDLESNSEISSLDDFYSDKNNEMISSYAKKTGRKQQDIETAIQYAYDAWYENESTPLNSVFDGESELKVTTLSKLMSWFKEGTM